MKRLTRILMKRLARVARPYVQSTGLMQVSGVYNRSAMVWEPGAENVLVLAPHMDDETIGCGGALALHARAGARVTVVFLTDGRNGAPGLADLSGPERLQRQQKLTAERTDEARRALAQLGIASMVCLGAEDGLLAESTHVTSELRQILHDVKPQLVYLPFFLEEHVDHRAASRILLDAADASLSSIQCMGYEVWTPLFPNCLVRIDSAVANKRAAIGEYRSQLIQSDYLHAALGLNAFRSSALLQGHGSFVEAFYACSLSDYRNFYRRYTDDRP